MLLCTLVGLRVISQGLEITRKIFELIHRAHAGGLCAFARGNPRFDGSLFFRGGIPPPAQALARLGDFPHRGLTVPFGALCPGARSFEIVAQGYSEPQNVLGPVAE